MDRRAFLASMPALVAAPRIAARGPAPIDVRGFNHVTIVVPDLKQAVDFYQGLFGFAKERRNRTVDAGLRIGPGAGMDLTTDRPDLTPRIDHFCLGIDRFEVDRVVRALEAHGLTKSRDRGAMQVQLSVRDGATLVYAGDPDGISVQLQDWRYCGGTGALGVECATPDPPPTRGVLAVRGYAGVAVTSPDPNRSRTFYRTLFGGVGGLVIGPGRAAIDRFSFNVDAFDRDRVAKALEGYGLQPRDVTTPTGRRSLSFTDLNGIRLELQ